MLLVTSGLFVDKFWQSQKLHVDFQLQGRLAPSKYSKVNRIYNSILHNNESDNH